MLDVKNTLILFGRSPYINEVKDQIPSLIDKYITMGCNYFCETFPNVDYVIFYDDICPKVENSVIVTQKKYFKDKKYKCAQEIPDYPKKELFEVVKNSNGFSSDENLLFFHFHTPSMALNWAWQKGFKNVVLVGIDLNNHTPHFDMDTTPDIDFPKWYDKDLVKAKKHIENIAGQYLNILQANPKSDMNLQKISIEDLLSDKMIVLKEKGQKKMVNVSIKLLSNVIIDGNIAGPNDSNGGIYTVTRAVATDLVYRRKAVIYDATTATKQNKAEKAETKETYLAYLKDVATELGITFNQKIGVDKLEVRVFNELEQLAEEVGLEFEENTPVKEAYEQYKAKVGEENAEELSVEELKAIAKEAEIDIEDVEDGALKDVVYSALLEYAKTLELQSIATDVKALWEQVKENLKENG